MLHSAMHAYRRHDKSSSLIIVTATFNPPDLVAANRVSALDARLARVITAWRLHSRSCVSCNVANAATTLFFTIGTWLPAAHDRLYNATAAARWLSGLSNEAILTRHRSPPFSTNAMRFWRLTERLDKAMPAYRAASMSFRSIRLISKAMPPCLAIQIWHCWSVERLVMTIAAVRAMDSSSSRKRLMTAGTTPLRAMGAWLSSRLEMLHKAMTAN